LFFHFGLPFDLVYDIDGLMGAGLSKACWAWHQLSSDMTTVTFYSETTGIMDVSASNKYKSKQQPKNGCQV
jgi:hypothetical protein